MVEASPPLLPTTLGRAVSYLEQFQASHDEGTGPRVFRIVLTGGPCAGKTTATTLLTERLESLGFAVYRVPEAATLLQTGGLNFAGLTSDQVIWMQAHLMQTQHSLESVFHGIAETAAASSGKPSILICDRGLQDGRAYISSERAWRRVIRRAMGSECRVADIRDARYDAVIHLVTAADGAAEAYTLANNSTRVEDTEQAIAVDQAIQHAWLGAPNHVIVGNDAPGGFQGKMRTTLALLCRTLGLPSPSANRRYFLMRTGPPDAATTARLLAEGEAAAAALAAAQASGTEATPGAAARVELAQLLQRSVLYTIRHIYLDPDTSGSWGEAGKAASPSPSPLLQPQAAGSPGGERQAPPLAMRQSVSSTFLQLSGPDRLVRITERTMLPEAALEQRDPEETEGEETAPEAALDAAGPGGGLRGAVGALARLPDGQLVTGLVGQRTFVMRARRTVDGDRQETQRQLQKRDAGRLMTKAMAGTEVVVKRRRAIVWRRRVFEWDEVVEPEQHRGLCLLSTEAEPSTAHLQEEEHDALLAGGRPSHVPTSIPLDQFPPALRELVQMEVTGDERYLSATLAGSWKPRDVESLDGGSATSDAPPTLGMDL